MSVLIVGSVALDYLETPFGKMERALGGSATFCSIAASYLTEDVRCVGIVGADFPEEHITYLTSRNIDLLGLIRMAEGKTFSWGGRYHEDMNTRDTLYTDLGVFEHFHPVIPEEWKKSEYVLLGNIHPALQMEVLEQIEDPRLVVCDTMNLWIDISRKELREVLKKVDVLILNDEEARMLTNERNLIVAGKKMIRMGPKVVVIKKGEHGAMLISKDNYFSTPAYPLEAIKDPTGAGDTFAGGFIGWLARSNDVSVANMRKAVVYGSVLASFCVEEFSIDGIRTLNTDALTERFTTFRAMCGF
ncbi:MAG: bifunctional hydroxymethylpyrimidine kinase/phosphomethylpyrimidine kinase [Bacteroidetes bacterium]|nr:bifunctional hydroxymethylpyrimidine kinase/phosphomethylpyrimidine kinase [Bacteroidota bacterium]